jgi:rubrerythrin
MQFLNSVLEKEIAKENFYREQADKSQKPGIKVIYNLLADEEDGHRKFLVQLKRKNLTPGYPVAGTSNMKILDELIWSESDFVFEPGEIEILYKALEHEGQTMELYRRTADLAIDNKSKLLLLKLAEEEKKHLDFIEELIEFIGRPRTWLETAEFVHTEEY